MFKEPVFIEAVVKTLDNILLTQRELITLTSERIYKTWKKEGRLILIGNGGSSAIASHYGEDFGKRTRVDQKSLLQVVTPMDSVPYLTAWSNDSSYEEAVMHLLEPIRLNKNDTLIAISGSGNSPNIINAVNYAKSQKTFIIGLTSQYADDNGGKLGKVADIKLIVPKLHLIKLNNACVMAGCEDIFGIFLHQQIEMLREKIITRK